MPSAEGIQIASDVFGVNLNVGMLLGLAGVIQAVMVLFVIFAPLGGWALFRLLKNPSNALFLGFGLILLFNVMSGGGFWLLKYSLKLNMPDGVLALITVGVASVLSLILGALGVASLRLDSMGKTKTAKDEVGAKYTPEFTFDGLSFDEKRRERQKKRHDYNNRRSH